MVDPLPQVQATLDDAPTSLQAAFAMKAKKRAIKIKEKPMKMADILAAKNEEMLQKRHDEAGPKKTGTDKFGDKNKEISELQGKRQGEAKRRL